MDTDKKYLVSAICDAKLATSRSEARRLVTLGVVEVDGVVVTSGAAEIPAQAKVAIRKPLATR